MSTRINRPKPKNISSTDEFNDSLAAGQTILETNADSLQYNQNAQISQISRIWDSTGNTPWYSDNPTVNGEKKGVLQNAQNIFELERITKTKDTFIPTTNQTVFTLTQIPIDPNAPFVFLNGQELTVGQAVFFSGTIMTINLSYQLDSNDKLVVHYEYLA